MGFSLDDVKELIKLLDATQIVDFQLELETGARLIIRKAGAQVPAPAGAGLRPESDESDAEARGTNGAGPGMVRKVAATSDPGEPRTAGEPAGGGEAGRGGSKLIEVTAPIVGTFYRAPSPGAEPFVSVGDHIEVGQTLCIIEAMKLMNEIQAEVAGRVVAVTAEDGQPVEYGQTLFLVEPD
ncbi:MAG: acetyl-CoA carboxylase biotin carboxyl carrier protein [Limnochordales bacterium]|nr:acetyl-CoA carboxylase biotin carboxyl carrier protein [Limnochordales bacterium]